MIRRNDVIKELPKKGFEIDRSGHHIYFRHKHSGRFTGPYTKVSHSSKTKEISGDLITLMKRQLWLDKGKQVDELVNCPMSGDDYTTVLRENGRL